jgi:hypothetical protein
MKNISFYYLIILIFQFLIIDIHQGFGQSTLRGSIYESYIGQELIHLYP